MNHLFSPRILVVDDEESVRKSVEYTLSPPKQNTEMSAAAALFFDEEDAVDTTTHDTAISFNLSFAANGSDALKAVVASLEDNQPFSVIFCDMRMPGWDGLKTVEEIRKVDPRIEVVFLTAYSDHSIEEISRSVGVNISYMSKPFVTLDLKQMATRCVVEWKKARQLEDFLQTLSSIRGQSEDIQRVLTYILTQLCILLDTDSAAIAEEDQEGNLHYSMGIGEFANASAFTKVIDALPNKSSLPSSPVTINNLRIMPIYSFGLALTISANSPLSADKKYLVSVFMEHAAVALKNCRLQKKLIEKEKFAEIGRTMSYVSHDLRGPLGQAEMMLKMLKNPASSPWPPEVLFNKILRRIHQAKELAEDILLYSQDNLSINRHPMLLSQFIDEDRDYWEHIAATNEVAFIITPFVDIEVSIDGKRFVRALTNIIKNAIEATAGKPQKQVTLSIQHNDQASVFTIQDTGGGIPEEVLENLFKPFATFGKSHGTGFGLAIAKQIVALHHGTITVSNLSGGAVFVISLPNAS